MYSRDGPWSRQKRKSLNPKRKQLSGVLSFTSHNFKCTRYTEKTQWKTHNKYIITQNWEKLLTTHNLISRKINILTKYIHTSKHKHTNVYEYYKTFTQISKNVHHSYNIRHEKDNMCNHLKWVQINYVLSACVSI